MLALINVWCLNAIFLKASLGNYIKAAVLATENILQRDGHPITARIATIRDLGRLPSF